MKQARSFEDLLPTWQAYARALAEKSGADSLPTIRARVASACPAWLVGQGLWLNPDADLDLAATDARAAIVRLSEPSEAQDPVADAAVVDASALAMPAAAGAALGALALAPLTLLWFDNRAIGLTLGGVLGAFLAVRAIAALVARPSVLVAAQRAAALAGGGVAIRGIWRVLSGGAPGVLRSSAWLVAVPLLLGIVRSGRQGPTSVDRARRLAAIDRAAALALAVCWSHPARLPPPQQPKLPGPEPLPGSVWLALARLRADLARETSIDHLRDSCEDLFQRYQEAGFDWTSAPPGALFDETIAKAFDTFGLIAPGQPIKTWRAAVTRNGKVISRGEVRRA